MDADTRLAFRRALGSFVTGVAVIAAARPDGRMSGITVNSFASVSLDPPLVLWCLGDQSDRYDCFAQAELWGVTLLGAADQALAARYALREEETIQPGEAELFSGAPVLKAGVAQFACRTFDRRVAGDHLIIIGEVLAHRAPGGAALTFYRGRYGQLGES